MPGVVGGLRSRYGDGERKHSYLNRLVVTWHSGLMGSYEYGVEGSREYVHK